VKYLHEKERNSNVALNKCNVKLDNNNSTQTKVIENSSRMNVMDIKEFKGKIIKDLLMNTMSIRKTTSKFYKYRKDPQKT
jgi:GTPase involved in cell partitioning and DNA repair